MLVAKGFCIGAADVVPGVSGGTVAFILGVYPRLINAIKSFDCQWLGMLLRGDVKGAINRPHFGFLIPTGVGVIIALFFFTRIVPLPLLVRTRPEAIYGLFFGLILGSIILLYRHTGTDTVIRYVFFLLAGLLCGSIVMNLVPASTPDDSWFIFLCGTIAIAAMLLPGLSGSFVLLMMKKYAYIFNAIGHINFTVIVPFALGVLTGVVLFSRVLSGLLNRFYQQTLLFIVGLLIASLYVIWPFQERIYAVVRGKERLISSAPYWPTAFNEQLVYSCTMMVLGFGIVVILDRCFGKAAEIR